MLQPILTRSRARRWVNILFCALMVFAVVLPLSLGRQSQPAQAAVIISKTDPTKAPPRGTPEKALHWAQEKGAKRITEARNYIYEVYRLAPLVGIDPALVISQSALETGDWTSFYWENHLNPAGIGIGYSGAPSYTWSSGTAAARFHLVRFYIYVAGPIDSGNPLYPYREDGPSYQRVFDLKYDGQVHILDDFTGRWATDPIYGQKVASRGTNLFAEAPTDPTAPGREVRVIDASGGIDPFRTRDGNLSTTFAIQGIDAPPPGGYVSYDMGRRVIFESIDWIFKGTGNADDFDLQTSNDTVTWTTRATYSNPPALAWQRYSEPITARYVRFFFRNPNGDMNVGFLAEVEFYGTNASGTPTPTFTPYPSPTATNTPIPTATPTKTPDPMATETPAVLPGEEIPIVGSGGSGIGNGSKYVWDRSIRTTWQTISSSPPSQAQVYVDLGATGTVTGVEFMFRRISGARSYQIRVSEDKRSWTTVAAFDYADPLVWQRARFTASARYVQFFFFNPTGTASLGYLAEVKVFGSDGSFDPSEDQPAATSTPELTATPTEAVIDASPIVEEPTEAAAAIETPTEFVTETPDPAPTEALEEVTEAPVAASPAASSGAIPILSLRRTANSEPATSLIDGNPVTTWQSLSFSPSRIYVIAEIEAPTYVGAIRWLPGPEGVSGDVQIEVTSDRVTWSPIGQSPGGDPGDWQSMSIGAEVLSVRIIVTNVAELAEIGGIAEIEILA